MLVDRQTLLSDKQAVTATAFSTDQYDLGAGSPSRNMGRLNGLRAVFTVQQAALAAGAATVVFEIGEADDAAGTNYQILAASPAIGKADLVIGGADDEHAGADGDDGDRGAARQRLPVQHLHGRACARAVPLPDQSGQEQHESYDDRQGGDQSHRELEHVSLLCSRRRSR